MIRVLGSSSYGNCYLIETKEETLILEAGIKYSEIKKVLNFDLSKVVGTLITHHHKDHSLIARELLNDGITIHAPQEVIENLEKKGRVNRKRTCICGDRDTFQAGKFLIKTFKNYHKNSDGTDCECLGYLINHKEIGTILFATDTYLIKPTFKSVDHILVECNFNNLDEELEEHDTRRLESHMSLNTLKKLLPRWNLDKTKTITLIHLSDTRADADLMQREIAELTGKKVLIAKKGLIIE